MVLKNLADLTHCRLLSQHDWDFDKDFSLTILCSAEVVAVNFADFRGFGFLPKSPGATPLPPLLKGAVIDVPEVAIDPSESLISGSGI
jgi:hypothetical protein